MSKTFSSVLFLDDMRRPSLFGVDWVRNYDQFVEWLLVHPMPELISFDHDLADEHYPVGENKLGVEIPYGAYHEKTGLDCARWIMEHDLPLQYWAVHSFNVQGRANIEAELRRYHPKGELQSLQIPYTLVN